MALDISMGAQTILDRKNSDRRVSFIFEGADRYQQNVDSDRIVFTEHAMQDVLNFIEAVEGSNPVLFDFSTLDGPTVLIYRKEDGVWRIVTSEDEVSATSLFDAYGFYGSYSHFYESFGDLDVTTDEEIDEYVDTICDTLDEEFVEEVLDVEDF